MFLWIACALFVVEFSSSLGKICPTCYQSTIITCTEVKASIVNQVYFNCSLGSCNVNMNEIYIFGGEFETKVYVAACDWSLL